ncbi:MAG: type IV pilus assembly protein PilM [Verrucomicrobia bacterium]|nr:type IV pilus assembly protein PilM [Verrucomicrobiota bacterium]
MLKSDRILGLDIGASSIKLAAFAPVKPEGLRLLSFAVADLPVDPTQDMDRNPLITATIKDLLRQQGIRGGRAVISVSGQSVFTRFVKLPPATPENIERMVGFEAQQNVPFPMEEVVWDYQLIGGGADKGEFEVVLVAIKSDIIEGLARAVEAAGLRVTLVDVSPLAFYNAARYNYDFAEGCTLLVDVGARTTNLLFIEQDKIFTRSIPIGGNTITQQVMSEFEENRLSFAQADELKRTKGFVGLGGAYEEPEDSMVARLSKTMRNVMTRLHAEIARSVIFYRTQQGGTAPTRLLLAGGCAALPYADHFFNEKLQVPVEFFNPFQHVEIDPAVNQDQLSKHAFFYGGAVGLGLRAAAAECPIEVNLLPKSLLAEREFNKKKVYLAGVAVGLAMAGVSWWWYFDRTAQEANNRAAEFKQRVEKKLGPLENRMTKLERDIAACEKIKDQIESQLRARDLWPQLFDDISKRVPADTWIIKLEPVNPAAAALGAPGEPPPELPPGDQPVRAKAPESKITELTITLGSIYKPKEPEPLQKQSKFLKALHESPFFVKEATKMTRGPTPKEGDFNFTFTITAKLKEPIAQ